jgi:hypothetical protein
MIKFLERLPSSLKLFLCQDTTFKNNPYGFQLEARVLSEISLSSLVYLHLEHYRVDYFGNLILSCETLEEVQLLSSRFEILEDLITCLFPTIVFHENLKHLVIREVSSLIIQVPTSTNTE